MVVVEVLVDDELRFHRLVKIQLYLVLSVMVVKEALVNDELRFHRHQRFLVIDLY